MQGRWGRGTQRVRLSLRSKPHEVGITISQRDLLCLMNGTGY